MRNDPQCTRMFPVPMHPVQLTPDLPAYRFDIFAGWPLEALVSTRRGGVSPPPWNSLNFSLMRGDSRPRVRTNLARFCQASGVRMQDVIIAGQIRGDCIQAVSARHRGQRIQSTDGLATDTQHLPLLTLYADCVPVVAYDTHRHVLGVCHAGWQGTTARIAAKLMQALRQTFGTDPRHCLCALGPSIGPDSYEIGPEVIQAVQAHLPQADSLLRPSARPGHAFLDLWQANCHQLMEAGVQADNVEVSHINTARHTDTFFSHRAERGQCGLFGMLCWLETA